MKINSVSLNATNVVKNQGKLKDISFNAWVKDQIKTNPHEVKSYKDVQVGTKTVLHESGYPIEVPVCENRLVTETVYDKVDAIVWKDAVGNDQDIQEPDRDSKKRFDVAGKIFARAGMHNITLKTVINQLEELEDKQQNEINEMKKRHAEEAKELQTKQDNERVSLENQRADYQAAYDECIAEAQRLID